MPQKKSKSKTPKGKKSKSKTSSVSHSGGAAAESQPSSRAASPSRAATPFSAASNDDFAEGFEDEIDGSFHSDAEQVLSPSHPQSHDELDNANSDPPPAPRSEVNSPPSSHDKVKTNPLSSDEVNSARSQPGCEPAQLPLSGRVADDQDGSSDSDVQWIGTLKPASAIADTAPQKVIEGENSQASASEISRPLPQSGENVAILDCVSAVNDGLIPSSSNTKERASAPLSLLNKSGKKHAEHNAADAAAGSRRETKKRDREKHRAPHGKVQGEAVAPEHSASTGTGRVAPAPTSDQAGSNVEQVSLSMLVTLVQKLEQQVAEQNTKLAKQAQQAVVSEKLAAERRAYEERAEDAHAAQLTEQIVSLQAQLEEAQQSLKEPKRSKLDDPEFASRLDALMRTGIYSLDNAMSALELTKQDGKYSSSRADAYLKTLSQNTRKEVLQRANSSLQGLGDDGQSIVEGSALGRLLSTYGNEDVIDIVVKLKDVHARRATKSTHSAIPAVAASNLLQSPAIKNDAKMGRRGLSFLSTVAAAVCEDCEKCGEMRTALETADKWKASQVEAAAAKQKHSKDKATNKRFTLPFKIVNSRRDITKPRGECAECGKGKRGGKWLYFCEDQCGRGFHALCVTWKHIRLMSGGRTWFACPHCINERDREVSQGNFALAYEEVDEQVEHDLAPRNSEASDDFDDETSGGEAMGGGASAGQPTNLQANTSQQPPPTAAQPSRSALTTPPATPASSSLLQLYGGGTAGIYPPRPRAGFEPDLSSTPGPGHTDQPYGGPTGNKANLGMNVKDYFIWHPVPKDWAPKPIPGAKPDTSKVPTTHPECGYSRTAYQNWRRKNVTQRDLVAAQGSTLGPLVRGISAEMKTSIGRQFLRERELKMLWPKPVMTDRDIDQWVLEDPDYKWVDRIPDDILLSLLDRRFGVKRPDLFLTRKFDEDLPTTDEHGDVNYHADKFNRWATDWHSELTELHKSGCDFTNVDLRQTLLTAVSTYKLIHREALQFNTQSASVLLAHLCDWVYEEEEKIQAARNKRASLVENPQPAPQAAPHQPDHTHQRAGGGPVHPLRPPRTQTAQALLTQLNQLNQIVQQMGNDNGGRPYPPHLKLVQDGTKLNCRGCNNNWDRARRSIPCYRSCKYSEHPDYNKDCKVKDGKQSPPLTWKHFRARYPQATPPASFLEWEKFNADAENPSPTNPSPRKRERQDKQDDA